MALFRARLRRHTPRSAYEAAHNPDASRLVAIATGRLQGEEETLRALVLAGFKLGAGRSLHYASPSAGELTEEIRAGAPAERFIQVADGNLRLCVLESVGIMPWYLAALVPAEQLRRPIAAAHALLAGIVGVSAVGLAFGLVRSAQIRKANLELAAALEELRAAQEHALQAERSAVLGSALAGMAHELNTPIGVALTSASFIGEQLAELGVESDPGLARLAKAAPIVESSLKRSSVIVSSFKRVAASRQLHSELTVLRVLIEKDLGARAEFEREGRSRLRIRILMDCA